MDEMMIALMFFSIYGFMFLLLGLYVLAIYLLDAIPLYKIGKKLGYDKNFLPWLGGLFATYALSDMPGMKDFSVTPKIDSFLKIRTRKKAFTIHLALTVLLPLLPVVFVLGYMVLLFIGSFFTEAVFMVFAMIMMLLYFLFIAVYMVLTYVIAAYNAMIHYVYLRDLAYIFIPDRNSAKTAAVTAAVLDHFTGGLAVPIYLCYLSRKEPLPEEPQDAAEENMTDGYAE